MPVAEYLKDYTAVLIVAIGGSAVVLGSFLISLLVAPRAKSALKDLPYECGIAPTGKHWTQMHFRYYAFAIMFLIFDVEAVFLFPWAVIFMGPDVTAAIFYEMLIFIGILFFGLLYGWRKGVLQWK